MGTAATCERVGSWQNEAMVRNFINVGIIWIIFFSSIRHLLNLLMLCYPVMSIVAET